MRRQLATIVLTSLFAAALLGATAAGASAAPPAQGVFENCPLDTNMSLCVQRLQTMHAGGVDVVVIGIGETKPDYLAFYAAVAHGLGMSVMWETSNQGWWRSPPTGTDMAGYFGGFAAACGCNQNGALLDYMIHYLGGLPGTYGYYAADDTMVQPGDGAAVASYTAQIKRDDPGHTVMIGSADASQTGSYQHAADVIGAEVYPVTDSSLLPVSRNQDMWGNVAQTAIDTQASANRAGKASAFILQAFTWGDNVWDGQAIGVCSAQDSQASCYAKAQYPAPAAQLELRNQVLAHAHPKLILWWSFPGTYGQAGSDTYSVYPTGAVAAARWSGLSAAIQAPWPTVKSRSRAALARAASIRRAARRKHSRRRHHGTRRRHHARRHARRRLA